MGFVDSTGYEWPDDPDQRRYAGSAVPSPSRPTSTSSMNYTDPNHPPPTPSSGGKWGWVVDAVTGLGKWVLNNAGDILQTGAGVAEGIMSSQDRAKQLAELARQYDQNLKQRQSEYDRSLGEQQAGREQSGSQFNRTTGDTEAQLAVRAQTQLNTAPIADNAQALLLKRLGVSPGQFQPRDYTKGASDLSRMNVAPGANVTSAMQQAAQNYKPGQGGVDTSAIKMLLEKMKASGFQPTVARTPSTPNIPVPGDRPITPRFPGRQPTLLPVPPEDPLNPHGIVRRRMGGI